MDSQTEREALGEWECMECGYVEAGAETQPPQECPECHAPVQALEFFPYEDDLEVAWEEAAADELTETDELYEDDEPIDEE